MKKVMSKLHLFMVVAILTMCFASTVLAGDLDSLNSGGNSSTSSDRSSVSDYLKNYTPVTDTNMQNATQYASPIVNALGTITGALLMFVSAGIFFVTALDLIYIGLPFTRSILNPNQSQGAGASPIGDMSPMYGGTQGASQSQQEYGFHRRWVSDEAVACVAKNTSQPQGGASPIGNMSPMYGGTQGASQPAPTKLVIATYLKKRAFFIVVFSLASILLTSSLLTGCGINLANLSFKILEKFNQIIAGVQI